MGHEKFELFTFASQIQLVLGAWFDWDMQLSVAQNLNAMQKRLQYVLDSYTLNQGKALDEMGGRLQKKNPEGKIGVAGDINTLLQSFDSEGFIQQESKKTGLIIFYKLEKLLFH